MVGSLGQPLLFLVSLGFGFGPVFQKAGAGNYLEFLAPGVIAMSILFTAVFAGMEIIWDKQFGFLKETLVAPVSRFKIMVGRTLGGATVSLLQGIVVFLLSLLIGYRLPALSAILPALVFMILIALLFTAFGTAVASTLSDMQGFQLIMNFIVMPTFFLSGALFPLQGLPKAMAGVVAFNPLAYGVDGLRTYLSGITYYSPSLDLLILSGVTVLLLVIGTYFFSRIEI